MKLQETIDIDLTDCGDLSSETVKKYRVGLYSLLDFLENVELETMQRADFRRWCGHLKTWLDVKPESLQTANDYSRYGRSHLKAIHARIAPI